MTEKEQILEYLKTTYDPLSILLYGSFQEGTNDDASDFDCLLIVKEKQKNHDGSVVAGIPLDCFLFTEEETLQEDPDLFLAAYRSEAVLDNGAGARLQERVRAYVKEQSVTDPEEKQHIVEWIGKTLSRMRKGDDEGNYRAVTLLNESLADYFILRDLFYEGSKKAAHALRERDPEGYRLWHEAITSRTNESIAAFAEHAADCERE